MGQAKLRGSIEQRKRKSLNPKFDQMTDAEKIAFFRCGDGSMFVGYVLYSYKEDTYVEKLSFSIPDLEVAILFTLDTEKALFFNSYGEAKDALNLVPNNPVVGIVFAENNCLKTFFKENNNETNIPCSIVMSDSV